MFSILCLCRSFFVVISNYVTFLTAPAECGTCGVPTCTVASLFELVLWDGNPLTNFIYHWPPVHVHLEAGVGEGIFLLELSVDPFLFTMEMLCVPFVVL